MVKEKVILISLLILHLLSCQAQEVHTFLDLQMHPTMHVPYFFFGKGFTYFKPDKEPKLSFKHQFRNVNYANYYEKNEGARIIVAGALTTEGIKNRKKARKVILKQINYVNEFAKANSEHFVVAKSPQEVRKLFNTTNKTIIIHSIEGAKRLINSQEDANFWAEQGVAFITLLHLVDSEFGASAIKPGLFTKLINLKGALKGKKKRRGLTSKGEQAILWLANAGIMIDLTHMSDTTRVDALDFMEVNHIPPIITHDLFRPIQNHPRGLTPDQILKVYKNGGFIGLPISGQSLKAHKPEKPYQIQLDSLKRIKCHCEGSIDSYKFTYQAIKTLLESRYINSQSENAPNSFITDIDKKRNGLYSIGFQSDFNGWVNHSRPKIGRKGCFQLEPGFEYKLIETQGMPHAGLLASQWRTMEKEGLDLAPIKRNAEHFLQLWEWFLEHKKSN